MRFALLALAIVCATPAMAQQLHLQDAWARFSPVAGRPAGVYLTIHGSAQPDRLIAASTPIAVRAEIHTHSHEGGVMKMRRIEAIAVPAGTEITLKPGGLHIMLFDVKQTPKVGASFPLKLHFANGGEQTVAVVVRPFNQVQPKAAPAGHAHN